LTANYVLAKNFTAGRRSDRQFSLFSIVQFPNDACTSSSSVFTKGTCLASSECNSKGGSASGNCAAGFGVCCVFSTSTCGATLSQNCSYFTNPGFPSTYSTTGSCSFTVAKSQDDICQLRLDFDTLAMGVMPQITIAANSNYGCCGSSCATIIAVASSPMDSLTVTGQTGSNPPVICGINTGSHMYLEMGTLATDTATLATYLGSGATGTRQWNIKVSQISCSAAWRAPTGCVQYYTGVSQPVTSYGHQSGQLLQSQNYNACTRQELGYCSNSWREAGQASLAGTTSLSPDPFGMTDAETTGEGENTLCVNSYVHIAGGDLGTGLPTGLSNTWCGEALQCDTCAVALAAAGRPAPVSTTSFYLGVFSDSGTMGVNPTATAATGFNLIYTQKACS